MSIHRDEIPISPNSKTAGHSVSIVFQHVSPSKPRNVVVLTPDKTINSVISVQKEYIDDYEKLYFATSQTNDLAHHANKEEKQPESETQINNEQPNNSETPTQEAELLKEIDVADAKEYLQSLYRTQLIQIDASNYLNSIYANISESKRQVDEQLMDIKLDELLGSMPKDEEEIKQPTTENRTRLLKKSNAQTIFNQPSIRAPSKINNVFEMNLLLKDGTEQEMLRENKISKLSNTVAELCECVTDKFNELTQLANNLQALPQIQSDIKSILKSTHLLEYVHFHI